MKQYQAVVENILTHGRPKGGPQSCGTLAVVGPQMRFELSDGFPLITTRDMRSRFRGMVIELLWYLSGSTTIEWLHRFGVHFWDQWGEAEMTVAYGRRLGDIGPIYGHQWRNFGATKLKDGSYARDGVDQIAQLIRELTKNPDNRRHRVTNWNPKDLPDLWIAPCHGDFQIVHFDGDLYLHHVQRSGDVPIGIPYNIVAYSLLLKMISQCTNYQPHTLIHTITDAHIYLDQVPMMQTLLTRQPYPLPQVEINPDITDILDYHPDDFELKNYQAHPGMKIPVFT